ncbi:glycine betaine ABC transporter substrate-binding protein [Virgibacillus sp. SK37]|uniref:glycine betaine ABC transporter substrate-binding protein n=1 Tax=Virgibacillus sp. SK37 TaxID=403957 RepID=UPI0004D1D56A|nr:glycine betaine ABC transporter substrate-binding protein [Virgibacillus sp. SK37]AIF42706.1 glycine/betaine ABC transporter [Virgibacillus sp. SK37]
MIKNSWKITIMTLSIAFLFVLSACGSDEKDSESDDVAEPNEETNYSEEVNYTITGIEPGAGISVTTDKAIEEYDSLKGWTANYSSTAAMASELDKAMKSEEPIVITGWNPHWTFAKYPDMKYLEDPKGIYGGKEVIKTLARNGLKEDMPNAYKLLDQFNWKVEDMEGIMYDAKDNDEEVAVAAERWVEENQDRVDEWKEGVEEVDGKSIELVSTPWDSERASSGVVKIALEQLGYDVTVTPVDVAVVFESIANGDGDATLAAWMPITHKDFYDKYSDQFDDLGANLEGAKIGLVVPSYMDIESIEDLEPAN